LSTRVKILDPVELEAAAAALPRPLVFTNGCFDILHRGHVACLEEARELGASLLVVLNSDASVRALKGDGRPVNPLADRLVVVAALACVDAVTHFDADTPLALIKQLRPDHLVKGGDWPVERIVGAREVASWGGQVHSIPVRFPCSTSQMLESLKRP